MPKKRPTNQTAFEFTYVLPADAKPIEMPPIIQPVLPNPAADSKRRIEAAKHLPAPPGLPGSAYQPDPAGAPGIPCDDCRFNLRPRLDYIMVSPGRRLCENCFEDEMEIERFGIDEWLEAHELDTDWHKEAVESLMV